MVIQFYGITEERVFTDHLEPVSLNTATCHPSNLSACPILFSPDDFLSEHFDTGPQLTEF